MVMSNGVVFYVVRRASWWLRWRKLSIKQPKQQFSHKTHEILQFSFGQIEFYPNGVTSVYVVLPNISDDSPKTAFWYQILAKIKRQKYFRTEKTKRKQKNGNQLHFSIHCVCVVYRYKYARLLFYPAQDFLFLAQPLDLSLRQKHSYLSHYEGIVLLCLLAQQNNKHNGKTKAPTKYTMEMRK